MPPNLLLFCIFIYDKKKKELFLKEIKVTVSPVNKRKSPWFVVE